MKSYKEQLKKIGIVKGMPVSYRNFSWRPARLSDAIHAMDSPSGFNQVTEKPGELDKAWTEECQGVAWDGSHWLFSCNGSQPISDSGPIIGNSPKAIYTFNGHTNFDDDAVVHQFIIATVVHGNATKSWDAKIPLPSFAGIYHIGAITCLEGKVYVDHWNNDGGQILVLDNNGGRLSFSGWITLGKAESQRVDLVCINPIDFTIYSSFGDIGVDRLFIHNKNGDLLRGLDGQPETLRLSPPINDGGYVQGGAFSPNGHIYISSGKAGLTNYQYIYCYSALNGHLLMRFGVLSEQDNQELEGICYAPVIRDGHNVHIHAVLLENIKVAKDNVFFKSFSATNPSIV
jgi:hypothetical protein